MKLPFQSVVSQNEDFCHKSYLLLLLLSSYIFNFLCVDPDPFWEQGSGSTKLLHTDSQHWPIRIQINLPDPRLNPNTNLLAGGVLYVSDLKPVSRYIRTHLIGTVSRDFDPFVIFLCYSIGAPYEQAKLVYTNSFVLAKILYYKAQNSCVRIVLAFDYPVCSIYFQTCKELILDM